MSRQLRILHVLEGLSPDLGGLVTSVTTWSDAVAGLGHDVQIWAMSQAATSRAADPMEGPLGLPPSVAVRLFRRDWPAVAGGSRELSRALKKLTRGPREQLPDVIHLHGLWLQVHRQTAAFARRARVPLLVTCHGMLEPHALTRSRHRKGIAWLAFQRRILSQARCLHVTCEVEKQNVTRLSLGAPIAVVPLSCGDVGSNGTDETFRRQFPQLAGKRIALYLGRIHPIKGLERFAAAWANVAAQFPNWQWVLAGPDEGGYRRVLERAIAQLGITDQTTFVGPVAGALKHSALAASELVVLPSEVESFGMSVLEALAAGRPALASRGCPWSELATHRSGLWVENTIKDWSAALRTTLARDSSDLLASGRRGQDWVLREFDPLTVASRFVQVYQWARGEHDQPECVQSI